MTEMISSCARLTFKACPLMLRLLIWRKVVVQYVFAGMRNDVRRLKIAEILNFLCQVLEFIHDVILIVVRSQELNGVATRGASPE